MEHRLDHELDRVNESWPPLRPWDTCPACKKGILKISPWDQEVLYCAECDVEYQIDGEYPLVSGDEMPISGMEE